MQWKYRRIDDVDWATCSPSMTYKEFLEANGVERVVEELISLQNNQFYENLFVFLEPFRAELSFWFGPEDALDFGCGWTACTLYFLEFTTYIDTHLLHLDDEEHEIQYNAYIDGLRKVLMENLPRDLLHELGCHRLIFSDVEEPEVQLDVEI